MSGVSRKLLQVQRLSLPDEKRPDALGKSCQSRRGKYTEKRAEPPSCATAFDYPGSRGVGQGNPSRLLSSPGAARCHRGDSLCYTWRFGKDQVFHQPGTRPPEEKITCSSMVNPPYRDRGQVGRTSRSLRPLRPQYRELSQPRRTRTARRTPVP